MQPARFQMFEPTFAIRTADDLLEDWALAFIALTLGFERFP